MLKKLSLVLVAVLLVISSSMAYADEVVDNMKAKLQRGIINTLTGWIEIPHQIYKGYNQGFRGEGENKLGGVVTGAVEGACAAAGRTISGVVDLVGFWALSPASNEGIGIPLEAEGVLDEGEIYDLTSPSIEEATITPVAEKVKRGLANTLFGIAEIPGQMSKGMKEGALDGGFIKGLWYFLSREISGAYDLVTICFPTPRDAVGNNFDEEWPWTTLAEGK